MAQLPRPGANPDEQRAGVEEVELYQRTYGDAPALERRDAAADPRVRPQGDAELAAPAGRLRRARPRRLPLRDPAPSARDRRRPDDRHGPGGRGLRPRRDRAAQRGWETVEAAARRRRWFAGPEQTWAVLLASGSDLDDLVPTLVAYQIEWNKLRRRLRGVGWPRAHGLPGAEECARVLGGAADDWTRLQEVWGTAYAARLGQVAERGLSLRVRMLGGTQVGYARMTRHWWTPVGACLNEKGLRDAPVYFVSSNTHSLVNLLSGRRDQPGAGDRRLGRSRGPGRPAHRARLVPREHLAGLVGELPLLRPEGLLRLRRRRGARTRRRAGRRHHAPELADGAPGRRAGPAARCPGPRPLRRAARGDRQRPPGRLGRGHRQRRLPARDLRLQHPARDQRGPRGAAGGLRARQGRDAERRRRRRPALQRHLRRALAHHLLARQRVRDRGHHAVPPIRIRARQPARGHGEVDVPAEPRLPGPLLPGGVHGGRDGGGALLQRRLRARRPGPLPGRASRSTSRSSRSTSGSSTTPPTPRTRRHGRSGRAASATTGWTPPTPPRSRSCGASSRVRRRLREIYPAGVGLPYEHPGPERAGQARREARAIKDQIEKGSLTVRQMTDEEKAKFAPKNPPKEPRKPRRKRPPR